MDGNHTTDTFSQVIEDPEELIRQMKDVRQTLFDYTPNNVEEFSSEISSIEDKQVLIDLKKALVSAKDCANIVRTFGDDSLKDAFSKVELTKLPDMLKEVQHHIDIINQRKPLPYLMRPSNLSMKLCKTSASISLKLERKK